jgi:hypothetical protein
MISTVVVFPARWAPGAETRPDVEVEPVHGDDVAVVLHEVAAGDGEVIRHRRAIKARLAAGASRVPAAAGGT